jgi:uncharacterized protein (DUF885 family)
MKSFLFAAGILAFAAPSAWAETVSPVGALANEAVKVQLDYDPTSAYQSGLTPPSNSRLPDRSPAGLKAYAAAQDRLYAKLIKLDIKGLSSGDAGQYAVLREQLEADRGMRVCHNEWWAVGHMSGWQGGIAQLPSVQPLGTPELRAAALERFGSLDRYVDTEIANLRMGLSKGYSVPKGVARRTLMQFRKLVDADPTKSPFWGMTERDKDPAFADALRKTIVERVNPALKRYGDFLETEYLPKARDSIGISALPNGMACYQAELRASTTLTRTPKEVYELGQATVADNLAKVKALGLKNYGTEDVPTILARTKADPANHFTSEDEYLAYAKDLVASARERSKSFFARLPAQDATVEPYPEYMRGSGYSAHYDASADPTKPGVYRIPLEDWKTSTKGDAQIVAFHEAWPGHHLQIATAYSVPSGDLMKLIFNGAYVEGWARYAERLSEEMGLYRGDEALIVRRIWPARGMVVDPGIHVFGWTRQQALDYLKSTGKFEGAAAEDMVDRISDMPAQLTSYDSGGLEIFALRAEAEKALGSRFDLKAFHSIVLEAGVVPLPELRRRVQLWIAAEKARA